MRNPPEGMTRILPHLIYDDVGAAVEWLSQAFGFRERAWVRHASRDGVVSRTQMEVGGDAVITLGLPSIHGGSPRAGVAGLLYVYVDEVDAHFARAIERGATVVMELGERPWGDRTYQVTDPQGQHWIFAEHVRDVDLSEEHLHGD